jgi:hypothetical protein
MPAKGETAPLSSIGLNSTPFMPTAVIYDNGPMVTHLGGGAGGADASALQTTLGMNIYGVGHQVSAGYRVADDFTITDAGGWQIDTITFFAYQTTSGTGSTITAVNLQIWDGVPGEPGSNVVWGDPTTNRLVNTTWTNIYRVLIQPDQCRRPIMADTVLVDIHLDPGTYWLDWQTDGTSPLALGHHRCQFRQTSTGNAGSTQLVWADLVDVGPQVTTSSSRVALVAVSVTSPGPLLTQLLAQLPGGDLLVLKSHLTRPGWQTVFIRGTLCDQQ